MTTVYSYIFRISSGGDEGGAAPAVSASPAAQSQPKMVPTPIVTAATPTQAPVAERRERERPVSTASSSRMSFVEMPIPAKAPPREVSEAVRLVRNLTDTRDSEQVSRVDQPRLHCKADIQRLNELYAFMKSSPENEAEARAAITTTLNPAAQTFVWRALDRRSGDAEPRAAASPARSPVREYHTPPLGSSASASASAWASASAASSGSQSQQTLFQSRPSSMVDASLPVDDKLAALTAIFRNRPRNSTSAHSITSVTSAHSDGASSRSSPVRPLSEVEPSKTGSPSPQPQRPRSEIAPATAATAVPGAGLGLGLD